MLHNNTLFTTVSTHSQYLHAGCSDTENRVGHLSRTGSFRKSRRLIFIIRDRNHCVLQEIN